MNSEKVFLFINEIRKGNREYLSNSFLNRIQLEELLRKSSTEVMVTEGAVVILEKEDSFYRVNFFVKDLPSLQKAETLLESFQIPVVADFVRKKNQPQPLFDALSKYGFRPYCRFVRMTKMIDEYSTSFEADQLIRVARLEEAEYVYSSILSEFDAYSAHFPSREDIRKAIASQEIFISENEGDLQGFVYVESISQRMACIRYIVVEEKFRGMGVASRLINSRLATMSLGAMCYLWVEDRNPAINLYEKIGFVSDGMEDRIMVNEKE